MVALILFVNMQRHLVGSLLTWS